MTSIALQPLSRTLLAAGLAVVGTIASFGATATPAFAGPAGYSAKLAAPVDGARKEVLGGALWKCEGAACRAPAETSSPAASCARVVKTFGKVASFATAKGAFSPEQLDKCNAKAAA